MNSNDMSRAGEYRPTLGRILWGMLIGALSFLLCLVVGIRATAFAIEAIFGSVPTYSEVYDGFGSHSTRSGSFVLGAITSLVVSAAIGFFVAYGVVRRVLKGADSGAALPFDSIK